MGETHVDTSQSRILLVKTAVEYTDVDGRSRSIAPGEHRITAVWAQGVPTGETELECWIVAEGDGGTRHDVDAETVAAWQESRSVEIGEIAAD